MSSVGVVIPTRNRLHFLAEAVGSILAQTRPADEVIIVNDGGSRIDTICSKSASIEVVHVEPRVGQPAALNRGIEACGADLIALCDDDDLFAPGHIEGLGELLAANREGLVYSSTSAFSESPDWPIGEMRRPFDADVMRVSNYIVPSSVMVSRQTVLELGGFDESLRNYWDWDFFLKVMAVSSVRHLDELLTQYRIHAQSVQVTTADADRRRQLDALCKRHGLGQLPLKHILENFAPFC
ncbi:glycosyltransferase family 2 protein [Myxococcota bacterium]